MNEYSEKTKPIKPNFHVNEDDSEQGRINP